MERNKVGLREDHSPFGGRNGRGRRTLGGCSLASLIFQALTQ